MLDSCSIHRGWLLLDCCSTTSRFLEILLHALFFTCFASFFSLVFHSILFHHIHAFIWILCTPLSSLCFSGEAFQVLVSFINHDKKGEKLWFLFQILHVKGRNTFLCKGEMCFILLGGVLTSFFLYTGLVTMFTYIVLIYIYIYIYDDVCFSPTFTCVVSFLSLYTWFLYLVCNLLFLFHTKMP